MRIKGALIATVLLACPAFAKPATTFTAEQFLEMNDTYREGLVQGVLSSWVVFGVGAEYEDAFAEGMKCQAEMAPKARAPEIAVRFSKYLDVHPDVKSAEFPFAFLTFLLDCHKSP